MKTELQKLIEKHGFNNPFKSWREGKKKAVIVKDSGKIRVIHYGALGYSDFTKHKDVERRRLFRLRMGCDPVSKLNKTSAKYWACQDLWK